MNEKRIILVLGMHRSGTSAVAKALETLGVSLGDNLMQADNFNKKGYFEDISLFRLNEQIMTFIGFDWNQLDIPDDNKIRNLCSTPFFENALELISGKLQEHPVLGLKDPRFCILLPFWEQVFNKSGARTSYVISNRNPLAVADSLMKRNQEPKIKSYWLWTIHMLKCLTHTEGKQRMMVCYEDLLTNPRIQVAKMANTLHLLVQPDHLEEFATRFLDPDLNHFTNEIDNADLADEFPSVAKEIYRSLKLWTGGQMQEDEIGRLIVRWQVELESFRSLMALYRLCQLEERKMTGIAVERYRVIEEQRQQIKEHEMIAVENDRQFRDLTAELKVRNKEIADLRELFSEHDRKLDMLQRNLSEIITTTNNLQETIQQKNAEIAGLSASVAEKEKIIARQSATILMIKYSVGWRITAPLRYLSDRFPGLKSMLSRNILFSRVMWRHFRSEYFDADWYLNRYPDVKSAGKNPFFHFTRRGMFEGRSPNAEFNIQNYLSLNPDVAGSGKPPVVHFMLHGFREKRNWKYSDRDGKTGPSAVPAEYAAWIGSNENNKQGKVIAPTEGPLISILLPVYRVKGDILDRAFRSVLCQEYRNWELCVVYSDLLNMENLAMVKTFSILDPRIRVEIMENQGISGNSNAALAMARGTFVGLLDHDDELSETALLAVVAAIQQTPEVDFLYTDKDSISEDSSTRQTPLFKPEWSPETMYSVNYVTHFNVIRKSLVEEVGGFRSCTDGAQDWDLFLRVTEKARKIVRVPGVHYHWRIHEGSTSTGLASKPYATDAQLRTIKDSFDRRGIAATVEPDHETGFRMIWDVTGISDVLLLIDGTGVKAALLYECITRALQNAGSLPQGFYRMTILADRNSVQEICERFTHQPGVEVVATPPGEKAGTINKILHSLDSSCPAIVFLSGKIDLASPGWLSELVGWVTQHPGIGFAGGLILDEQDRVVEAGLVTDDQFSGTPLFRGNPLRSWGWFGGPLWFRNTSACNPWIVAMNAEVCRMAGHFDEENGWSRAFIRKCRTIISNGWRGLITPHVRGTLAEKEIPEAPVFHACLGNDPYFHPAFASVVPLHLVSENQRAPVVESPAAPLNPFAFEAQIHAGSYLCSAADLAETQQHPERLGKGEGAGWCNWYIPCFENPAYGGPMTILRFADMLRRNRNLRQRFIVLGDPDTVLLQRRITTLYPELADSEYMRLPSDKFIPAVPPSDFSFSTLWNTAYSLLKIKNTGLKFYFIQDFEPLFYPAGSVYAQTELTYHFGFYGIVNTWPLRQVYEQEYHGTAIHFVPQVDNRVFHGDPLRSGEDPKRIFFYARPDHPRNGFELASEAMKILKRKMGTRVSILCAGATFDERRYGLEGVVQNLGILDYEETAALYRTCDIGLVMMMTRHPSYLPFELMACGTLVISNYNQVNSWLLKHEENCLLVKPNSMTIAEQLEHAVLNFEQYNEVRKRGHDMIHEGYTNWERSFLPVVEFIDHLSAGRL